MTRLPHNIEKSRFTGEYVGYSNGAWRIRYSAGMKGWVATKIGTNAVSSLFATTLRELGAQLARG